MGEAGGFQDSSLILHRGTGAPSKYNSLFTGGRAKNYYRYLPDVGSARDTTLRARCWARFGQVLN